MNPNDLLGTRYNPPGFDTVRAISRVAKAYHSLSPYPAFSEMTRNWKTEERGPFPRCRPFVRRIVNRGARWLFGKPVTFRVGEDKESAELVNQAWTENDMNRRSVAMATTGALSGGVVLKWSYDKDQTETGARIHVLDPAEQTRLYWEDEMLLMARVQYPFFDATTGKWIWYREEWTDDIFRVYEELPLNAVTPLSPTGDPYSFAPVADVYDKWEIKSEERNPFGIIPLWYVRNSEVGREFGEGDLWNCYHIIDQVNYTYDLAHKHNQKFVDPSKAYIDLEPSTDDAPDASGPGGAEVLETKEGAPAQGKVQALETDGSMRGPLREFTQDLLRDLFDTVGAVDVSPEEITNKGNLTSAVLTQLYAPLIEITDSKRTCYGEDGVCVFFERMSRGLAAVNAQGWKPLDDVQIHWPAYFDVPEEEKTAAVTRQSLMVTNRFTTQKRAVQELAKLDGVIDVNDLLVEIEREPDPAGEDAGEETNAKSPRKERSA